MPKRILAVVLVGLLAFNGCSVRKVQKLPIATLSQPDKEKIVGITTIKGEDVSFDPPGASISNRTLIATVKKVAYQIRLDQVQRALGPPKWNSLSPTPLPLEV
jgi:hypothetical protein